MDLCVHEFDEENYIVHIGPCTDEFDIWLKGVYEALEL